MTYTYILTWLQRGYYKKNLLRVEIELDTQPFKTLGDIIYNQIKFSAILRSAHKVYLCVMYGSENLQ